MNIATYSRVSSLAQDVELSMTAQIGALRRYALDNDMVIVEEEHLVVDAKQDINPRL